MTIDWITNPLNQIDALLDQHLKTHDIKNVYSWGEREALEEVLEGCDIPWWNETVVPYNQLVRARLMIQELQDPEMYVAFYQDVNGVLRTTKYRDNFHSDSGDQTALRGTAGLRQRNVAYGVDIPGLTAWAKKDRRMTLDRKRIREEDEPVAKLSGMNFPLPWEENARSLAARLKFYDVTDAKLKMHDVVEVVAVLTESIPASLHVLHLRTVKDWNPLAARISDWQSDSLPAVRARLIEYLSTALGDDTLAAEYLLLCVLARVFNHYEGRPLGIFSLGLSGFPLASSHEALSPAAEAVYTTLSNVLPTVSPLVLSLDTLTQRRWKPVKDYECDRMMAGMLQQAAGTLILVDETSLQEGNIQSTAVEQFNTLAHVINEYKLSMNVGAYEVECPMECPVVVLSAGPSLLKALQVQVKLQGDVGMGGNAPEFSSEIVEQFRFYVAHCTRNCEPVSMLDGVEKYAAEHFANARQAGRDISSETFHLWMTIARVYAISHGERLSKEIWDRVMEMENRRCARA